MSKKTEQPPFKMRIEGGRLVPASQWDAERLDTYRPGSTVDVVITQEKASWRQRKYWAILGAVVKNCPVQQKRAEDLHKAIRLKLGIVDSFTPLGGATKVELRSTTSMGEQEFEAFYFEAMELLKEVTGVDVETLGKEAADVGPDDQEKPEAETSEVSGPEASDKGTPETEVAGLEQSASGGPDGGGAEASAEAPPSNDDKIIARMRECLTKMIGVVTDPKVPEPKDRQENLVFAKNVWRDDLKARPAFVKACYDKLQKVVLGKMPIEEAKAYLETLIR